MSEQPADAFADQIAAYYQTLIAGGVPTDLAARLTIDRHGAHLYAAWRFRAGPNDSSVADAVLRRLDERTRTRLA